MEQISWTEMRHGTQADYEFLGTKFTNHVRATLVDNLFTMMRVLEGPTLGYQCDRLSHSLQSATRAYRNDETPDMVVGALFHDIGDVFAPENHSQAAAAILAPYVDEETTWVVRHHGIFQGYYYFHHFGNDREARDRYQSSPYYDRCVDFCASYDQNCFDPAYPAMNLEEFRPLATEVFSRSPQMGLAGA